MDHLPSIRSPVRPPLQVPYLTEQQPKCGYGGFDDFPARCGVKTSELQHGNLGGIAIDAILPFLQEWLFFGLLQEIFGHAGVVFRRGDFIRSSPSGQLVLTTEPLQRYIWYWAASITWARDTLSGPKSPSEQKRRVGRILELCNRCLNGVARSQSENGVQGASSGRDIVLLSITILGETLDVARDTVFFSGREEFYGVLSWELPHVGTRLLRDAGWCTGEIAALRRDFPDVSSLHYFSTWNRSVLGKNHTSCGDKCLANQIDEKTYETKHTDPECVFAACAHVPVKKRQVCLSILDDGGIPVVWFSDDGEIHVQRAAPAENLESAATTPYVAVSHVWSDGLGNARSNTLPRCQLRRIQRLVNALYSDLVGEGEHQQPVLFWIDTLCVPLEPAYRKLAIRRMSQTYLDADKVLVLDASFSLVSVHEPIQECMMRVSTSPWATRLWTFQEGVLALQLHFQFSNGTITPSAMEIRSRTEGKGHTTLASYLDHTPERMPLEDSTTLKLVRALAAGLQTHPSEPIHLSVGRESQELWKSLANQCHDFPVYHDNALFSSLKGNFSNIVLTSSVKAFMKVLGGSYLRDLYRPAGPARQRWADRPGSTLYDFLPVVGIRTSSKPDDETLCIGGVLGLDIAPLLKCREAERLKTFLSLLDTIPPDLIFAPGPRMQDAGYRWAPMSLMNAILEPLPQLLRAVDPPKPAHLHPRGLLVTLPGLKIRRAAFPERSTLFIVGTGFDDHVRLKLELVDGGRWSDYSDLDSLVVLMSTYTDRAALAFLREKVEGRLFAEFRARLVAEEYGDGFDSDVKVKVMDDDVRWCVD